MLYILHLYLSSHKLKFSTFVHLYVFKKKECASFPAVLSLFPLGGNGTKMVLCTEFSGGFNSEFVQPAAVKQALLSVVFVPLILCYFKC